MATPQILGRLQRGIDRTRIRGDADVSSLYDLENAYITTAGRPKKRDGFVVITASEIPALDPNTRGLFSAGGKLHTFYSVASVMELQPVVHHRLPPPPGDPDPSLVAVHYCSLYLGGLYVVAEFDDGSIWHYWLRSATTVAWKPNTVHMNGDVVQPTTQNGYYYTASSPFPAPVAWAPNVKRVVGDVVQPTVYNGWQYTVIEVDGDNPASGAIEPTWPTTDGAQVYEDVDNTPAPTMPGTGSGSTPGGDRYGNLPGFIRSAAE